MSYIIIDTVIYYSILLYSTCITRFSTMVYFMFCSDLSFNQITAIKSDTFKGLPKLYRL